MASKCITCFNPVVVIVWCVQLNGTYSGECCGRVGVQRRMCGVLQASVVQIVCMLTIASRPQQRRALDSVHARMGRPIGG